MTTPTKAENPSAIYWVGRVAILAAIVCSIATAGMATMSVFYGNLSWLAIPIFIVPQLTVAIYALLAQRSKQP